MLQKQEFLTRAAQALPQIYDQLSRLPECSLSSLHPGATALIIVDMVNGFVKQGALSSPRIYSINQKVAELASACSRLTIPVLAFGDCHTEESPEFTSFPVHCKIDSEESRVTDEIAAFPHQYIAKNSTNGFLEPVFRQWLQSHPSKDTFIVVGDCTDLCVNQFCTTLKAYFNQKNRLSQVIVPIDLVETYDLGEHDADLLNIMTCYSMRVAGIQLASHITA